VLQLGWFILDQICIKSSNIVFTLNLSPEKQVPLFPRNRDSTSSANGNEHTDHQSLLVWPRTGSLEARVSHYEAINLEQPSSIKVELSTGQNNVIDCRVFLRAASAGLRLHTAEAKLIDGDIKLMDVSQSGSISISSLPPDTKADIIIPYSIETDLREISVRIMIEYTTSDGEFAYTCNTNLPIFLPLAINVQDVFKQAVLVSKFTIGTSSSVPVRISNCRLEGTPDFRVEMPPRKGDDFDVFVRQPLSLISKIYQNSRQFNGSTVARNKLFLKLEYRCLDTIVHAAVQKRFLSALEATTHQKFSRVLGPTLLTALRSRVGAQDLEAICLLREVDMGTFDEWGWDLLLAGIPSEDSQGLERWLRSWHEVRSIISLYHIMLTSLKENRKIRLEDDTAESAMQYLTVPVEIPQMQVVHSARLRRLLTSSAPPQLDSVPMGKGIPMELTISHTRKWGNLNLKETASQALEFCFEIHANPDIWVVGGQRRAHFSAMVSKNDGGQIFVCLLYI